MKPFSICMIAKNEEQNLERCLKSVAPFDCEIIVVDTGSTDRTKEIAAQYATRVLDFEWTKDFSAARNFSIAAATYDRILVLDCDEWVVEADVEEMLALAKEYPFYMGQLTRKNLKTNGTDRGAYTDLVERFFNRRYFRYEGTIHEQTVPYSQGELIGFAIPLTVWHSGYIGNPKQLEEKRKRNMELIQKELEAHPDDPYFYFQMGQEYYCMDDYENAIKYYSKLLTFDLNPDLLYLHMALQSYGNSLLSLGRIEEALQFENIYDTFSYTPDFCFLMGRIYYLAGQPIKAMQEFIKATTLENPRSDGANSYLCWYYIGLINEDFGEYAAARAFYEKCGDFDAAKQRLELLNQQQK